MSFQKEIVKTTKAPGAVGTYSQGVIYQGICYFSGQIGLHPATGEMAIGFESASHSNSNAFRASQL